MDLLTSAATDISSVASRSQTHLSSAVTKPKSFLDLPVELRNVVYSTVLREDKDVIIPVSGKRAAPALLVTCKRIRHEARKIYYTVNNFRAKMTWHSMDGPKAWVQAAPVASMPYIGRFTIGFITYSRFRKANLPNDKAEMSVAGWSFSFAQDYVKQQRPEWTEEECVRLACNRVGTECAGVLKLLLAAGLTPSCIKFNTYPRGDTAQPSVRLNFWANAADRLRESTRAALPGTDLVEFGGYDSCYGRNASRVRRFARDVVLDLVDEV